MFFYFFQTVYVKDTDWDQEYIQFSVEENYTVNEDLKLLIKQVRDERKKTKRCLSAQDGVSINNILKQIVDSDFYKQDYKDVTSQLLFKEYSYEDAIKSLSKIIKRNIFEE